MIAHHPKPRLIARAGWYALAGAMLVVLMVVLFELPDIVDAVLR